MHWQIRNPLPKPLVGPSLIEIQDIGLEEAVELPLMEDQEMIQTFSPHTSQKTFTNGICLGSSVRRSKHFDATGGCHACKMQSEFPVVIPNQLFGRLPIRSCLPQLLRYPAISGRPRHIHMDDLPRLQLDNEEGEKGTKEEISDLQEITGPHLCRMIAEKGPPSLSISASWMDLLHILLNSLFTHVNIQLEKFSTNTFRSPKSIVCRHFFD